ncbi:MAG: VWA domain-containing protein [Deltaproteobacteria bacterium]|nr:VWA domain-containing protein [Kofleriaceae bacterium]
MKRLCRDVSRWDVYLHREARALPAASELDSPRRQLEDELFGVLYSGEVIELPVRQRHREHSGWANQVHEQCARLPQFERLVAECHGDPVAAAAAVEVLLSSLGDPQMQPEDHVVRRQLRTACMKAGDAVAEVREALAALEHVNVAASSGTRTSTGGARTSDRAVALARALREMPRLRELSRLAGRVKQIASTRRRGRVRRIPEEIGDVEQGSDLGRLLPSELVRLAHPRMRRAALRSLLEHDALQYGVKGRDPRGRGPLVVCVDKSGSMEGEADTWATAVALALLDQAQEERRRFVLLGFDTEVKYEAIVASGETLPVEYLFAGCAGGTSIDRVIERGLELIEREPGFGKADLVLITDGVSEPERAVELRQRASSRGVSIIGVGIGVDVSRLAPWCSPATSTSELSTLDPTTAATLFAA